MPASPVLFSETLVAHPASAWVGDLSLKARASWQNTDALLLNYTLSGPGIASLRVPQPLPPSAADGLWQHTCFEAFVAACDGEAYHEYNFSPSGQWAHYRFSAERVRDRAAEPVPPGARWPMAWTMGQELLQLQVELVLADWPAPPHALDPVAGWRLGLSAVLEHSNGRLSHWALHHPRTQPDFHHPAGRVLQLSTPVR